MVPVNSELLSAEPLERRLQLIDKHYFDAKQALLCGDLTDTSVFKKLRKEKARLLTSSNVSA
jgi:ribosomal protein L29